MMITIVVLLKPDPEGKNAIHHVLMNANSELL
jgi:hypothetical protein